MIRLIKQEGLPATVLRAGKYRTLRVDPQDLADWLKANTYAKRSVTGRIQTTTLVPSANKSERNMRNDENP